MSKAVKIVVGVCVVIMVVSFGSLLLPPSSSVSSVNSASTENAASQSSEAPDYSNMRIGDTVTLVNGLKITVNETEVFTPEYLKSTMTRVNVTYENTGDEKQSFNLLDWKSENSSGVERSITAWSDGKTDLGSGNLKPGGTITGNVYFDGDDITSVYYYNNVLFQSDSDVCWNL